MLKNFLIHTYKIIRENLRKYNLGRFYLLQAVNEMVLRNLRSNYAVVKGHKMFLDPYDSLNLSVNGIYEDFETKIVENIVSEGQVVVDIGANIGYYTLIFAKLVGSNGRVFAFEPDPENFEILKRNIVLNNYSNVIPINSAVSNFNGKIRLFVSESNKGDHRIYDSFDGRKFIEADCMTLDVFCSNNNIKPDFIKMDIQGAELLALQGMKKTINSTDSKFTIISEFWPAGINRSGGSSKEFLRILNDANIKIFEICESDAAIKQTNADFLLNKYSVISDSQTNLICSKNENWDYSQKH